VDFTDALLLTVLKCKFLLFTLIFVNFIFRIHALHSEFREVEKTHAVEIRSIRDELESLRQVYKRTFEGLLCKYCLHDAIET
jgi:hypothetical protein